MTEILMVLVSQGLFAKAYGGTGLEYARDVIRTSDGGFLISGTTQAFGAGSDEFMVMKLDASGNLTWVRTIGGTGSDECFRATQTPDGGYAIGGVTYSYGGGVADAFVVKLDGTGNFLWNRTFGATGEDRIHAIITTSDGGIATAGRTINYGAGGADFLVMKLNSAGTLQWARTCGGSSTDDAYAMTETSDSGIVVVGLSYSFTATSGDVYIAKFSSGGNFLWSKTYGGASTDDAFGVTETYGKGLAVTGYCMSYGAGNGDIFVLMLDSLGNLSWARVIGQTSDDWVSASCRPRTPAWLFLEGGRAPTGMSTY